MRHIVTGLMVLLAAPLAAQDWQGITDDFTLSELLTQNDLEYENGAWQSFELSGRTLYRHGESSWGYWRVEGARYCSQWPPRDDWDCYDVAQSTDGRVRFTDDWGNHSVGVPAE